MGIDAEMFVRTKQSVTSADLRRAEHELYCRFRGDEMYTYRDNLLEIVDKWEQDGPDELPGPGETFIRVSLMTRYYGEGYERGDFRLIHDLAEVLEHLFPEGSVWYGGGSSGVVASPFGAAERAALRALWMQVAHKPYSRSVNPFMSKADTAPGPDCRKCEIPMQRNGWGPGYAAFFCECGERVETRAGKTTVTSRVERRKRKNELQRAAYALLEKSDPTAMRELQDLTLHD